MCNITSRVFLLQLAAWATEALFKYGGEPHFVFPTTLGPANQAIGGSPAHFQATPTYQAGGQYPSSPAAAQVMLQRLACDQLDSCSDLSRDPILAQWAPPHRSPGLPWVSTECRPVGLWGGPSLARRCSSRGSTTACVATSPGS